MSQTVPLLVTSMTHMNRCPLSFTVNSQNSSSSLVAPSLRPPVVRKSGQISNLPHRSLASTDVEIILADVLDTTCNLAVLVIQSLAVNAAEVFDERVESDVLYCASLAVPCEMESLTVRASVTAACRAVS